MKKFIFITLISLFFIFPFIMPEKVSADTQSINYVSFWYSDLEHDNVGPIALQNNGLVNGWWNTTQHITTSRYFRGSFVVEKALPCGGGPVTISGQLAQWNNNVFSYGVTEVYAEMQDKSIITCSISDASGMSKNFTCNLPSPNLFTINFTMEDFATSEFSQFLMITRTQDIVCSNPATDLSGIENNQNTIISQNQQQINQNNTIIDQNNKAEETRKGIWETIKNLPSAFLDMLKSLFIPEDNYFSNWFDDLQEFFEEKLGFLVTPFTIFIEFVERYLELDSSNSIVINIPDISVPNFENHVIIKATTFNWTELLESKESLKILWNLYLSFIDVFLILNFINLCHNKYNEIFGGSTSNYEYYTVEDSYTYDNNSGEVLSTRRNERKTIRKKVDDK